MSRRPPPVEEGAIQWLSLSPTYLGQADALGRTLNRGLNLVSTPSNALRLWGMNVNAEAFGFCGDMQTSGLKSGIMLSGNIAARHRDLSRLSRLAGRDLGGQAIRGRGVDAELGGEIRLTGNARQPVPVGQFDLIRGRADLMGKHFNLTERLIDLEGSMVPVLRLAAQTRQAGITTSIVIEVDALDPDITFESSPELPEEEVLSQLLFGRGTANISALQAVPRFLPQDLASARQADPFWASGRS